MSRNRDLQARNKQVRERILITICFLAALTFWFVLKMMQTYENTRSMGISYEIPGHLLFDVTPPPQLMVRYRGQGWALLFSNQKFRQPVVIEYSETTRSYTTLQLIRKVADHIGEAGIEIINIDPESIQLEVVEGTSKKVPVVPHFSIETLTNHYTGETITVIPDSVTVYGAPGQLRNIHEWPTEFIEMEQVRDTVRRTVPLKRPVEGVTLDRYIVDFLLPVEAYTEKVVELPIILTNVPGTTSVRVEPRMARIFCLVPLRKYAMVDSTYFSAEADIAEINIGQITATIPVNVDLKKEADYIRSYDFQPRMVEVVFMPSPEPLHHE